MAMTQSKSKAAGLPVVLRVKQHGRSAAASVRVAEMKQTWSRGAAWAVAAPMVCLSTAFGWYVANRDVMAMSQNSASEAVAVVADQQPPTVASRTTTAPMPPRRMQLAPAGEIVQTGFSQSETAVHVDSGVARVQPPSVESNDGSGLPNLKKVPKDDSSDDEQVRPTASANRAATSGRNSQIRGVFRIEE